MPELLVKRTLTHELARVGISRAIEESRTMNCLTCIAVLDNAGHLISFDRMDGAPFQSSQLAQDKAYSVAGNGMATHEFWEMAKDEPWLVHNLGQVPGLVVLGGGIPIYFNGEFIGAVGVSGKSDMAEDRAIAEAAVAAIRKALA
ncbi:heme-binding protein [Arthrobacter sp. UC242_113]|uniref:GlcG/HbpS family heme-binding protein n=1 Tax=Arthrobacter sp. UC242_113 TaxID=3374550 RepID=UPI0037580F4E